LSCADSNNLFISQLWSAMAILSPKLSPEDLLLKGKA
jgi:hypothetical protein